MKKLRRLGIADLAAANAYLETTYWADHNGRFAQPPASPDDFHVRIPRGVRLDAVFRLETTRTVANDWVVRYANRYFQLERQSQQPPARSTVQVYEAIDGAIEIRYRGRGLRHHELSAAALRTQRASVAPTAASAPMSTPPRGQSADHPWRSQAVSDHYAYKELAKARRAWDRVQP